MEIRSSGLGCFVVDKGKMVAEFLGPNARNFAEVFCQMQESKETIKEMHQALSVIALDPKIKEWLEMNDPKALEQVEKARKLYKEK